MSRTIRIVVGAGDAGSRLDQCITTRLPEISRSSAARLIREGRVTVDEIPVQKPSHRIESGMIVTIELPEPRATSVDAQAIPLALIYEDEAIAIIDKPAGLVVHPAAGHADGTVVNALLHHLDDLSGVGGELRPGIVHRLDKETSGLLVVAKHDRAHRALSEAWNTDSVRKFYRSIVYGTPTPETGRIEGPIGRHPRDRKRMAIVPSGKSATTLYRVLASFTGCSLLELELKSGRTHQIRVHLQSIGHPVVGDQVYGGAQWKGIPERSVRELLRSLDRQALHASRLELVHPVSRERMVFDSPLPEDMTRVLEGLGAPPSLWQSDR